MKIKIAFAITILLGISSFSQTQKDSLLRIWKNTSIADSLRANALSNLIFNEYQYKKPDSALLLIENLENFIQAKKLDKHQADALILKGNVFTVNGDNLKAIEYYQKALKNYETFHDSKGITTALNNIGRVYKSIWNFDKALDYYNRSLQIAIAINDKTSQSRALVNIGNIYNDKFKVDEALSYYTKSLELNLELNDKVGESITLQNIGLNYTKRKEYDKALDYFMQSLSISEALNDYYSQSNNLIAIAQLYYTQKNYPQLIKYSNKALEAAEKVNSIQLQNRANFFLYQGYKALNNFTKALYHHEESIKFLDSLNIAETEKRIQEIEFEKQRSTDSIINQQNALKQKLVFDQEIEIKKRENKIILITFTGIFILISFIAYLIYTRIKRQQRILEQEKELEIQKKEKLLKEQELSTIDAMLEGQEKERKRLAMDLHDSIGATLSAVKLQFNHLAKNKDQILEMEDLFYKTSTLIDQAYAEVRSISHLKYSGVMAKEGLLPAIYSLAKNASAQGTLKIEVQDFGVTHTFDATTEVAIFRIIQELITNIIKHSHAAEANISLTQHKMMLTIMVEDNGIGFNKKTIYSKKGMGLSSVEKRIEHMDGTLDIDSTPGKGTTIIIELPLK